MSPANNIHRGRLSVGTTLVGLICVTNLLLSSARLASAQGTKSDYERADKLGGLVQGKVFKAKVTPHWLEGNSRFWYRNDLADGKREFILIDAEKGTREAAFDHAKLAMALHSIMPSAPRLTTPSPVSRIAYMTATLSSQRTLSLERFVNTREPRPESRPLKCISAHPASANRRWPVFSIDHPL